jgi:thiosulfate reductase cytochrome b subunit
LNDYDIIINPLEVQDRQPPRSNSFLRWWAAEIAASMLSIASLLSVMIVLRKYEGRSINDLGLPSWLTLNGIVATISTINRVCLMLPVGSAISQEAWLWFSGAGQTGKYSCRLQDLEKSDAASRGASGSLML